MTKTADVVAATQIAVAWGNEIRDRTLQIVASTAERDASFPSPVRGQAIYIASNDVNEGLYIWDGLAWRPPWNTSWGLVSSVNTTTFQSTTLASYSDITFAQLSWTGIQNRLYRISLYLVLTLASATGNPTTSIQTGLSGAGTVVQEYGQPPLTVPTSPLGVFYALVTGTGALQYHARWATGGGTLSISSTQKNWMTVEDIGPLVGTPF